LFRARRGRRSGDLARLGLRENWPSAKGRTIGRAQQLAEHRAVAEKGKKEEDIEKRKGRSTKGKDRKALKGLGGGTRLPPKNRSGAGQVSQERTRRARSTKPTSEEGRTKERLRNKRDDKERRKQKGAGVKRDWAARPI